MTDETHLLHPLEERRALEDTETKIAIAGHPLHAMLVAFPIALAFCTLGADLLYAWTGNTFWSDVAGYAIFGAFALGVLAGMTGTAELLLVRGIRNRSASWTHFILAVMLLSILGTNWMIRIDDPQGAVLPVGLVLSLVAAGMTALTGWHGGKLVFDYQIGVRAEGSERP